MPETSIEDALARIRKRTYAIARLREEREKAKRSANFWENTRKEKNARIAELNQMIEVDIKILKEIS